MKGVKVKGKKMRDNKIALQTALLEEEFEIRAEKDRQDEDSWRTFQRTLEPTFHLWESFAHFLDNQIKVINRIHAGEEPSPEELEKAEIYFFRWKNGKVQIFLEEEAGYCDWLLDQEEREELAAYSEA